MPISLKIKTGAIDKARLYVGKTGEHYLDVMLIETPNSKYHDDYVVVQAVSKEERLQGVKGNILGNAKIVGQKPAPAAAANPAPATEAPRAQTEPDDVPF